MPQPPAETDTFHPWHEMPTITRVECDAAGKLRVLLDGESDPVENAQIARCFPWSFPQDYISVRDSAGKEVTLLESLDALDEASREVILTELHHKIFNPCITGVSECEMEFGVTTITATTDRGPVTFQIASRDDVRYLTGTRLLLQDVDANTYEIPDLTALAPDSRRTLSAFL